MAIEVGGRTVETDEEGYLKDIGDWSEAVATSIAQAEKLDMTETHWGLVEAAREFYHDRGRHPSTHDLVAVLSHHLIKKHGEARHEVDRYLYKLFPYGPDKQLAKIAGLPKPLPADTE